MKSKSVFATDIAYLNDSREYQVALDAFERASSDRMTSADPDLTAVLSEAKTWLTRPRWSSQAFVFCLSEYGDQLSQWRGYCNPGNAYVIGFNVASLAALGALQGFHLAKCLYAEADHDALMQKVLTHTETLLDRELNRSDITREQARGNATAICMIAFRNSAPLIKDSTFEEEGEWRLILSFRNDSKMDLHFREGRSFLTPYVVLALTTPDIKKLPIKYIRVGPGPHQEADRASTLDMLMRSGSEGAEAALSRVPYRDW